MKKLIKLIFKFVLAFIKWSLILDALNFIFSGSRGKKKYKFKF